MRNSISSAHILAITLVLGVAACSGANPSEDASTAADVGPPAADSGLPADSGDGIADARADAGPPADSGEVAPDAMIVCMPTDPIDVLGVDSDCDGADGEAASTLYVSAAGNATNPGTAALPVDSLQQAVTIARGNAAIRAVLVAASTSAYSSAGLGSALAAGVSVFGGYDPASWSRPLGLGTPRGATRLSVARHGETVLGPAPGSGVMPRVAVLSDVEISVDDALPTLGDGRDSVVLVVNNSPSLTLRRLELKATDGASLVGVLPPPPNGAPGVDGGDASGVTGGNIMCTSALRGGDAQDRLSEKLSGDGSYFVLGNQGDGPALGSGQQSGGQPATVAQLLSGRVGTAPGTMEAEGGSVAGGLQRVNPTLGLGGHVPAFTIDDVGLIRHVDVAPTAGRLGSGGGAGRSCTIIPDQTFHRGGGGGAGGCSGQPGVNGRPGGSSVGVVVTGAPPLLEQVSITVGDGGAGTDASSGGRGGDGGDGADGVGSCPYNGNPSYATGGGGGASAGGGGGGTGGNGGLAVAVLVRAASVPADRLTEVTVARGVGGAAGAAGAGGPAGTPGIGGRNGRGAAGAIAGNGEQNQPGSAGNAGLDGVSADSLAVAP